jgi:hypothetical protein
MREIRFDYIGNVPGGIGGAMKAARNTPKTPMRIITPIPAAAKVSR